MELLQKNSLVGEPCTPDYMISDLRSVCGGASIWGLAFDIISLNSVTESNVVLCLLNHVSHCSWYGLITATHSVQTNYYVVMCVRSGDMM